MTPVATLFATPAVATSRRSHVKRAHRAGRAPAVAVRALTRPDAPSTIVKIASGVSASLTAALVALPAFADEAAGAGEISPFAGVVDITVLGVVGLLAVQGNKKAEAAKAAGGAKGKKKRGDALRRTASA